MGCPINKEGGRIITVVSLSRKEYGITKIMDNIFHSGGSSVSDGSPG